ncbi:MAG TPA: hypothetical protein EYP59_00230 [Thiotrichaceae bacterium]|nr:hypothetical protein [Thiotrichaceae bacterium]
MINNNKTDFNQCVALVLRLLYKAFPRETNIVVDDLTESLDEEKTDNYFASIRFLQRENFIRYQELHYNCFNGVVLTAKGLKVLDTFLDNKFNEEKTIGDEISHALQDENEKAVERVIREVIKLSA